MTGEGIFGFLELDLEMINSNGPILMCACGTKPAKVEFESKLICGDCAKARSQALLEELQGRS